MGLLGKSFTSKIKSITTVAVSRIVILKNQHKARASYARSDVAQLLNLGYHDPALLRVDQWILEQNMLEVFSMIENYCNFLREKAEALETNKECPVDLKETLSSLIFASSRCGDFPELHKIREILTSRFGKEFANHAVELHKNNRVNSKMIQKLSPKRPTMEVRMKALKQIASEIGVTLSLEQEPVLINKDKLNVEGREDERETRKNSVDDHNQKVNIQNNEEKIVQRELVSDRNEERREIKTLAWEDFHLNLNPRDNMTTISKNAELISKEHVEEANTEDNTDHNSNSDVATENEHFKFSEERVHASSNAIKWNSQRSQSDPTQHPFITRRVMETRDPTQLQKQIHIHHEHVDSKMMSVRSRRSKGE